MDINTADKLTDSYIGIIEAKDIKGLIGLYQLILHNKRYLSTTHLEKVKTFLNEFYVPTITLSELLKDPKILEDFNSDPCYITRLKNLLTDLYDHSQAKGYSYSYIAQKSGKND